MLSPVSELSKIARFYPQRALSLGKERFEFYFSLCLGDFLALGLSLILAYLVRSLLGSFSFLSEFNWWLSLQNLWPNFWIFLPIPLVFTFQRLYDRRLPFWDETKEIVKALCLSFIFVYALVAMGKLSGSVSRLGIGLFFIFSLFLVPAFRYLTKRTLFSLAPFRRKALILGAKNGASKLLQALEREKYLGYEVIGFLDNDSQSNGSFIGGKKVFGPIKQLGKFVSILGVESVFVAVPSFTSKELSDLFATVQRKVKEVCIVPDFNNFGMLNTETQTLLHDQLFLLRVQNNLCSPVNQAIKRIFDIFFALLILPFILPLMGLISLLIVLDSPGSPIFVQKRLGKDGKLFNLYKFRTMYINADEILDKFLKENSQAFSEWQKFKKLKTKDPRVTRVGSWLRKISLDELPQIFNVLKGEMSLVGPRPYLPRERLDMGKWKEIILISRPGITGLWQVSGRNELTFKDRLKMDTWYVLNWSLWLDISISIRTIKAVFTSSGSY